MSVLMIAEKPSLAQSLANILSNGNMNGRKGGPCPVWEYRGQFRNESVQFKFTSVCGHVFTTGFEAKYSDWDKTDPIELFDAKILRVEANKKMQLVKFLKKEAKGCKYIVLWLDCDKEGENICFEILDIVKETMTCSFKNPQTVFRAHFSAITAKDIKAAFGTLGLPNELESLSVTARQELDLVIGCSFTRYQTKFFHGKYGDLDTNLISYGPCQVPTLGFCVTRHDEIENFVSKPYWVLSAVAVPESSASRQFINLQWMGEREFKQDKIKQLHNQVKSIREGFVESLKKSKKSLPRPKALNTVEMLKIASSRLGIGPHVAMQTAERLYTQGYISYPRTETNQYPKNFNLKECLAIQERSSVWGKDVSELLRNGIATPRSGTDAGDHPPITPMRSAEMHELGGESWRIYEFITRHFISSLAPDMIKEVMSLVVNIGGQKFKATCSSVIDPGFTKFMHRSRGEDDFEEEEEQSLIPVNMKQGDKLLVSEVKVLENRTKAPGYLTESELISQMERHGIGTDASIPTHINNIILRNYVQIDSGRTVVPTKLGIFLVHGYRKIDPELVAPTSRREMEKELNQIAKGEQDFKVVLKNNIELFRKKFVFFMENIRAMDELFESNFTSLAETGKPFSRCGKCRRFMKLISSKPERLVCNTCDDVYPIPRGGNVKTYKEEQCPIDNFDLIYFSGANKKYIFCPYCSANPPFEDMVMGSNCMQCTSETCKLSQYSNSLGPCTVCDQKGQLVLDQGSGPGSWKAYCTHCTFNMSLFKDATKVQFINDECEKCKKRLITLKYPAGKSKLDSGSTDFKGCFHCSDELSSVIEAIQKFSLSSAQKAEAGRGQFQYGDAGSGRGRGGGRGRGTRGTKPERGARGARGRGGKNANPDPRSFSPDYDEGRGRGRRGRDTGPVYNRGHSPMRLDIDWEAMGLGGDSAPTSSAPRPRSPSPQIMRTTRGNDRGRGRGNSARGRGRGSGAFTTSHRNRSPSPVNPNSFPSLGSEPLSSADGNVRGNNKNTTGRGRGDSRSGKFSAPRNRSPSPVNNFPSLGSAQAGCGSGNRGGGNQRNAQNNRRDDGPRGGYHNNDSQRGGYSNNNGYSRRDPSPPPRFQQNFGDSRGGGRSQRGGHRDDYNRNDGPRGGSSRGNDGPRGGSSRDNDGPRGGSSRGNDGSRGGSSRDNEGSRGGYSRENDGPRCDYSRNDGPRGGYPRNNDGQRDGYSRNNDGPRGGYSNNDGSRGAYSRDNDGPRGGYSNDRPRGGYSNANNDRPRGGYSNNNGDNRHRDPSPPPRFQQNFDNPRGGGRGQRGGHRGSRGGANYNRGGRGGF